MFRCGSCTFLLYQSSIFHDINCSLMQQFNQSWTCPVLWCGCSGAATSHCCLVSPLVCLPPGRPAPRSSLNTQPPTLIDEHPLFSICIPGARFHNVGFFAHLFLQINHHSILAIVLCIDFALKGQAHKIRVIFRASLKGQYSNCWLLNLCIFLGWTRPLPRQQQVHTQWFEHF
jgi:hypothetical protein